MQLILCMETTKSANTDYIYIRETLNYFYEITSGIKITPIYLSGKGNYKKQSVLREIERNEKKYRVVAEGDTKVIYFIDTDSYHEKPEDKKFFDDFLAYMYSKGYDAIWFCRNIEEVYLHKNVSSEDKIKNAEQFKAKSCIGQVAKSRINCDEINLKRSNILRVFDKYLTKKKDLINS